MDTTLIMTYQLATRRFITNETRILTVGNKDVNLGSTVRRARGTPRKKNWENVPSTWVPDDDTSAGQSAGQPSPDEGDNGDEQSDDEDEDDAEAIEEEEVVDQPGVVNFKTAINIVWKRIKEKHLLCEEPVSGKESHVLVPGTSNDQRMSMEETIQGPALLALFMRHMKIRTGQGVLNYSDDHEEELPVTGRKVFRLGRWYFDEDRMKRGEWPICSLVSFDEAHILRNVNSTYHIMAALIPKKAQVLYTGTPIYNDPSDIRAYMALAAHLSGIDRDLELVSDDVERLAQHFTSSKALIEQGLVAIKSGANHQRLEKCFSWCDEDLDRRRWWPLLAAFRRMACSSDEHTKLVAARLFSSSYVSGRKASTPLIDHKGNTVYPTSGLPPCIVRTIEVSHCPEVQELLVAATDVMLRQLSTRPDKKNKQDKKKRKSTGPLGGVIEAVLRHLMNLEDDDDVDAEGPSAFAYYRILKTIAADFHYYAMFFDPTVNDKDPLQKMSKQLTDDINLLADSKYDPAKGIPDHMARDRSEQARLGCKEVANMALLDRYNGLVYRHLLLAPNGNLPTNDTVHMNGFALCKSPVLTNVMKMIFDGLSQPETYGSRVLVVVESPVEQT